MASSVFTAFFKDPKITAGAIARRYRLAFWLVVASMLMTGLLMRPSEVTVVILGLNVMLLWFAVTLFKHARTGVWLVILAQILAATQMTPHRVTALALVLNLTLLLGAIIAARLAAASGKGA